MIVHLYRSKSDIENLSRFKTILPNGVDRYDYKGYVVNKPWGYEYLVYENESVAIWMLHVKQGHGTSMHCHPNKKTSLIVIRGEVVCSTLEGFMIKRAGEGLIIESSVFHSTRATSPRGAMVMEIESPPNKRDLVRLKDAYGRQGKQYEGISEMSKDVHLYEYIDFCSISPKVRSSRRFGNCIMSLCLHNRLHTVHHRIRRDSSDLLCLLSGNLSDHTGKIILAAGEVAAVSELRKVSRLVAFRAIMYLTLRLRPKHAHQSKKAIR